MKFKTTGKSLNELHAIYGEGKGGFYSHWFKNEDFANDKPEAGTYEIKLEKKTLHNLTYLEQKEQLPKGYDLPHPAVLAEALLSHFKKSGKYLMEYWYSRTSLVYSNGGHVWLGGCGAEGVDVNGWSGGHRSGSVGVGASRKFDQSLETRKLESLEPSPLDPSVRIANALERIADSMEKKGVPKKVKTAKPVEPTNQART